MKKSTKWVLAILSIHACAILLGQMREWRMASYIDRTNFWKATSREQAKTVELYDLALDDCSQVVGHHSRLLAALRERSPGLFADYSWSIGVLERVTPELSKHAKEARAAKSENRFPLAEL